MSLGDRTGIAQAPAHPGYRAKVRKPRPCPCGCGASGFCDEHRARLHEIRDRMVESGRRKVKLNPDGTRQKPRAPRCCNPQCDNPRRYGEQFCPECIAEGWEQAA